MSEVSKKVLDCFLAFGAGIMIASSFFSLLNPAIEKANELNKNYNEYILIPRSEKVKSFF